MILDGTRPVRGAIALDRGKNTPPGRATHREIEYPHDEQAAIPPGIATCFLRARRYNEDRRRRKVRIYLDVVFALNGAVNYFLMCASSRLCGTSPRQRRLLGAALIGALYACVTFLPGYGFLSGGLWRAGVLMAMLWTAFRRRLLLPGAVFLALSLAMGGMVLLLSGVFGAGIWLLEGRAFYAVGAPTLVLTAGAFYLGAWLLLQGSMGHTGGLVPARLRLGDAVTELTVLRDTGNTLRDPFTGRAVAVVERQVIERLLPGISLADDAISAMQTLRDRAPEIKTRLIPYYAVGTQHSLLPALRCDSLRLGRDERRDVYVAVSPTRVSEHGQYEGLIGEGE